LAGDLSKAFPELLISQDLYEDRRGGFYGVPVVPYRINLGIIREKKV